MKFVIEQRLSTLRLFNGSEIFTKNGEQKWVNNLISLIRGIACAGFEQIINQNGTKNPKKKVRNHYETTQDTPDACRYYPGSTRVL